MEHGRGKVHFSAIGGVGMVAGARLAIEAGWEVRGSDTALYPPASDMVAALGVPVAKTFAAENLDWNPDVVVVGNVLSRGNDEVEAALSRRMRFLSLPEWLKEHVLRSRLPIVVSGTHGKTTTTALLAHVFAQCGVDVGYLVGGMPLDLPHSSRLGPRGAPFVIEGDEYDCAFFDKRAKFLHYLPDTAIVTSLEFDHGDIYATLSEIQTAFQRLLRQLPSSGRLILCADNAARELAARSYCPVISYGFAEDADWRAGVPDERDSRQCFEITKHGAPWCEISTRLPGHYNARNILAAAAAADSYGVDGASFSRAIAEFQGVRRRMEVFHEFEGALFVEDFAHHPTAVAAAITAARGRWPDRRLRVLFEPRSNTTTRKCFQEDLTHAFQDADQVLLGPIHRAEKIAEAERLDRAVLTETLQERGIEAAFEDAIPLLVERLQATLSPQDLVLILSNGAFGGIYEQIRALR